MSPHLMHHSVFIISQYVSPKSNSTGKYFHDLLCRLDEDGIGCTLITTGVDYKDIGSIQGLVRIIAKGPLFEDVRKNLVKRFINEVWLGIKILTVIISNTNKGDVVITGTNPASMPIFALLGKLWKRNKWMVIVHDVFPDNAKAAAIAGSRTKLFGLLSRIYNHSYTKADFVIAIGRDMVSIMKEKGVDVNNIEYVPLWVQNVMPFRDSVAGQTNQQARKINLQYFGNFGRVQGIENMLQAFESLRPDGVHIELVGSGVLKEAIVEYINESGLRNKVTISEGVPFESRYDVIDRCDVALVCLSPGMYGLAVPSKAYCAIELGKKIFVIGDKYCELHLLILENPSIGWFSEAGDTKNITQTLMAAIETYEPCSEEAVAKVLGAQSKEKLTGKIVAQIHQLLQTP